MAEAAREALARTPLDESLWLERADRIAPPDRRWVEIARVLAADPTVVLLDEPSAGFGTHDTARLFETITSMRSQGIGVLLVTHDVSLAASLSDKIVVMHNGRELATGDPADILTNEEVIVTYLGEKGRRAATAALSRSQSGGHASH